MLGTASRGAPVTCARVFAVSTPTRKPVNRPGPDPDGEPADLAEVDAGPGEQLLERRGHAFLPGLARDLDPPEDRRLGADRDRDLWGRGVDADDDHDDHRPSAAAIASPRSAQAGAGRLDRDAPGLVGAGRVAPDELDAEPVFGEQTRDRVAPLDEQDPFAVLELVQRQVDHVLLALEPVQVDVRERHTAGHVLAHEGERRRSHVLGRAEPGGDPLDERGLARAELPGEDDDVARAQERRERGARGARVVGGRRLEDERGRQNSSSWSSGTAGSVVALQPDERRHGAGAVRGRGEEDSGSVSVRLISAKSSCSSPNCRLFSPPPCKIAAGWNVGITLRPCHG